MDFKFHTLPAVKLKQVRDTQTNVKNIFTYSMIYSGADKCEK